MTAMVDATKKHGEERVDPELGWVVGSPIPATTMLRTYATGHLLPAFGIRILSSAAPLRLRIDEDATSADTALMRVLIVEVTPGRVAFGSSSSDRVTTRWNLNFSQVGSGQRGGNTSLFSAVF